MIDADTFIREIKTLFTPALADSWRYRSFAARFYGSNWHMGTSHMKKERLNNRHSLEQIKNFSMHLLATLLNLQLYS